MGDRENPGPLVAPGLNYSLLQVTTAVKLALWRQPHRIKVPCVSALRCPSSGAWDRIGASGAAICPASRSPIQMSLKGGRNLAIRGSISSPWARRHLTAAGESSCTFPFSGLKQRRKEGATGRHYHYQMTILVLALPSQFPELLMGSMGSVGSV